MRVYGGEITCSSSLTWAYMARKNSCSPGNTNGGAGWRNCRSWYCVVDQDCHAAVFPSVRNASFTSSPGRFDLLVKSRSSRSAGEYQPGPLVSYSFSVHGKTTCRQIQYRRVNYSASKQTHIYTQYSVYSTQQVYTNIYIYIQVCP